MENKNVYRQIVRLISYGLSTRLIERPDVTYVTNRLLLLFGLDEPDEVAELEDVHETPDSLSDILERMLDYAYERGLIADNTTTHRDLFDTEIMGTLVKRPSEVIADFYRYYDTAPYAATDYYYKLSCDSDYIRRYRIRRDMKWVASTEYGDLNITVNLSKPEKDPKEIAAAKHSRQAGYPRCLLCKENEGYAGRLNHPARGNHRVIPVTLDGRQWYLQYSPYVYYNEHCIVFSKEHSPMVIDESTLRKLIDFVRQFPHYFVGSNADLPIVGGSILSHEHFQGGNYEFAMARAPMEVTFTVAGFEDVEVGIVKWPMSVLRLCCADGERLVCLAAHILECWRSYTDEACFIYAETDGERHNTVTPIARRRGDKYELDLVLRNNITTEEYPMGVYHPHEELHHIKKENIGLIEVMGLAVLPARLKEEMHHLKEAMLDGRDIRRDGELAKHADWAEEIMKKYERIDIDNIDDILKQEIGIVFLRVLEDAGVYKRTEDGRKGFMRFVESL